MFLAPDVAIVGCGKAKASVAAPARELYVGGLFRASLRYALARGSRRVYVASAKHGLLELDQVVEPYDYTIGGKPGDVQRAWGAWIAAELRARSAGTRHELGGRLLLLAGDTYAAPIRRELARTTWTVEEPLRGLELGARLQRLRLDTTALEHEREAA